MKKIVILLLFLLCNIIKAQVNLNSGLVLYYPFNGNANDYSINGINGMLMNGATFTSDPFGNPNSAIKFDGIDDYFLSDSSSILNNLSEPFSISLWAKIDSWFINSWGSWAPLISKTGATDIQYRVEVSKDSLAWLSPLFCNTPKGSVMPALGSWFNFVLIQKANGVDTYMNGVHTSSFTCTQTISNGHSMTIGNDYHNVTEYLNGSIDEVRIYNRALTNQEVSVLTNIKVNNLTQQKIQITPNPSTRQFNLNGLVGENTIQITDIAGKIIFTEKTNTEKHTIKLDASQGIYFYKITNKQNRVQQGKLILE